MAETKRRTFQEAMEARYQEMIDSMRDENGVVQPPRFVPPPALTCEEQELNKRASHRGNQTVQ